MRAKARELVGQETAFELVEIAQEFLSEHNTAPISLHEQMIERDHLAKKALASHLTWPHSWLVDLLQEAEAARLKAIEQAKQEAKRQEVLQLVCYSMAMCSVDMLTD